MEARGERESSFTKHIGGKQGKTRDKQEGQGQKTKKLLPYDTRGGRAYPQGARNRSSVAPRRATPRHEGGSESSVARNGGGEETKTRGKGAGNERHAKKTRSTIVPDTIPWYSRVAWHQNGKSRVCRCNSAHPGYLPRCNHSIPLWVCKYKEHLDININTKRFLCKRPECYWF